MAGLEKLRRINEGMNRAKAQGGVAGNIKVAGYGLAAAATFAKLYLLPGKHEALPETSRLQPAW